MKQFRVCKGPFIRARDSYKTVMFSFFIVFIPFLVYSFYHEGIVPYMDKTINFSNMFYPLVFVLSPVVVVFVLDVLNKIIFHSKESFKNYFRHSFASFSALFTALLFNINTPLWIIICSTVIAYILHKLLFEKVYSISILAYVIGIIITISLGEVYNVNHTSLYTGINNIDTLISGASGFDNLLLTGSNLVPALISIISFVYLILKKDSKYMISCSALISVFVSTLIISLISGNGLLYPLYFLVTNGVLFLIFILASDFYGPSSIDGQIIYGLFLGLMIVIFRMISNVDITFISLFVMNTFSFYLDYIGEVGSRKVIYPVIGAVLLIFSFLFGILI